MIPEVEYRVSLSSLDDIRELAPRWQELQEKADNEFFLSWCWISTWLEVFKPEVKLLVIEKGEQIIALALTTLSSERRHRWLRSNVVRLHQTGDPLDDQIWIEYNDILVDKRHRTAASEALARFLSKNHDYWDEWVIGASRSSHVDSLLPKRFHRHVLWEAPSFGVDLKALRESGRGYLQTLSRNTRYQLNKAYRLVEKSGGLCYSRAQDQQQAISWFKEVGDLHLQRWGTKSGFNNERFIAFHHALITRGIEQQSVELVRVEVGNCLLGILYNFIYRGKVYFYLSGINYQEMADIKPGLICHVECVNHHLQTGDYYYDFMGGDARYKRSLGRQGDTLQLVAFQKPIAKLKLEQTFRQFKRLLVNG